MDVYSGKRAVNGLVVPRRGLRNTADTIDENVQLCSRLGCSGRLNRLKSSRVGVTEECRPLRLTLNSSNGKDDVGSSSRTSQVQTNVKKTHEQSGRNNFSQVGNDQSELSSMDGVPEVTEQMQSSSECQRRFNSAVRDTGSSKARSTEVGWSSATSSSGRLKILFRKSGSYNQRTPMHSSISSTSKAADSEKPCISGSRYGLRNLKCNSISDVLPHNCSMSESRFSRRDIVKRRNSEGDSSSSAKGKKRIEASPKERHVSRPTRGISFSESRSSRKLDYSANNHVGSVQARGSLNVSSRLRGPVHDSLQTKSSGSVQNIHCPGTPNLNHWSSSQVSTDASSGDSSACNFPGNDIDDIPSVVSFTSVDLGINQLVHRQALQEYNIDGVAQVLLALERIEQDEELTYEQLLALETDLLLSGLNSYDQHRHMRLDIDNMSYEELLALGESMGTVSTALSEEALSKCLQRSIYQGMHAEIGGVGGDGEDEIKCSICQEEYVIGDEIGELECKHGYHVECVQEWLKLKNWCPVCKAPATSSDSELTKIQL